MTHVLKLLDKDFKAVNLILFNEVKEKTYNEWKNRKYQKNRKYGKELNRNSRTENVIWNLKISQDSCKSRMEMIG